MQNTVTGEMQRELDRHVDLMREKCSFWTKIERCTMLDHPEWIAVHNEIDACVNDTMLHIIDLTEQYPDDKKEWIPQVPLPLLC
jgi:hypothetical protein